MQDIEITGKFLLRNTEERVLVLLMEDPDLGNRIITVPMSTIDGRTTRWLESGQSVTLLVRAVTYNGVVNVVEGIKVVSL